MKKLISILALIVATIANLQAQEVPAKAAFVAGDYTAAIKLYQAAIATASSSTQEASLSQAMKNAQVCLDLLQRANNAYNRGEYSKAKSLYQKILNYNSSDKYAEQRVSSCSKQILIAANKRKQQSDCQKALKDGRVDALKTYITSYPNSEQSKLFEYILYKNDSLPNEKEIATYIKIGDLFSVAKNKSSAQLWYDKAASLGNAEALYKKALTYDDLTSQQVRSLLALSYAGGYKEALDKLNEYPKDKWHYDESAAKQLYNNLCKYKTDLYAIVYVYENKEYYNLNKLNLDYYIRYHPFLKDVKGVSYNNNLIYQFAKILEGIKVNPKMVMEVAAMKGNVDAVEWLFNNSVSLTASERLAYKCYLDTYNSNDQADYYEAYVKYLKDQDMTLEDWGNMGQLSIIDRHELLLSRSFDTRYTSDKYCFKSIKLLINRYNSQPWDSNVISEMKRLSYKYVPKRAKKIVKILSKLSLKEGVYNKTASPTYNFVKLGYCNNRHKYTQQVTKEKLWGDSATTARATSNMKIAQSGANSGSTKYSSSSSTTSASNQSNDQKIIDCIRSRFGGQLIIKSSGTAISKDGETTFHISVIGDRTLGITVSGETGHAVSFSNRMLALTLKNGNLSASSNDLRSCRYISFFGSLELSEKGLECFVSYTTAAYASFSAIKTFAITSKSSSKKSSRKR